MYSLVLMTAMTATPADVPQFGFRRRGGGCCGGACVGCVGTYGCYGCGGCAGRHVSFGCGGCGGWYAPWYAVGGGCTGCVGHAVPVVPVAPPPVGGGAKIGAVRDVWGANYAYSDSTPFLPGYPAYRTNPVEPKTATARLTIEVPSGASLYVDGQKMKSTDEVRQFYTPPLAAGQTYFYDVRVEVLKGKEVVAETKRVYVRANDTLRESFKNLGENGSVAKK